MVKKERKKTAIAYICLSVALLISTLLGISFAWFTDTATGNGSAQFGVIDLGTVTASNKTNVMPGDTMSNLGSFTYSANAESAYWRATYEITDIAAAELDAYFLANPIAPEFGAISSSANLQTINLARTITIPTSLTNAYQEQTITIKITIDTIQQANLPAEANTPQTAFAYMDANNLNYATGEEKVAAAPFVLNANGGTGTQPNIVLGSGENAGKFSFASTTTPSKSGQEFYYYSNLANDAGAVSNGTRYDVLENVWYNIPANNTLYATYLTPNNTTGDNSKANGNIIIKNKITSIEFMAFFSCEKLTSITIPSSVTSIKNMAFSCSRALTSISLPYSLIIIGDEAFEGCSGLTSITIPSSVTSIGGMCFNETGVISITIPSSVTSIGEKAFTGDALNSLLVDPENTKYTSQYNGVEQNCIIDKTTNTLIGSCKNTTIPSSVTSIGRYAFAGYGPGYTGGLTSITIPSSVTSIGDRAFKDCTNLTSVTFENPNGWVANGTSLVLTDTSTNATYLKTTYGDFAWTRS